MQMVNAHDGYEVAGYARDVGSHVVEQVAELLYIRFARRVIYRGRAFRHDSRHYDVGRAGDRSLIEEHVGAL